MRSFGLMMLGCIVTVMIFTFVTPTTALTCTVHAQCENVNISNHFCDTKNGCVPCRYCSDLTSIDGECPSSCSESSSDCSDTKLNGRTLRVAMYYGELATCDTCNTTWQETTRFENKVSKKWGGYDVELLEALAEQGGFDYTIINMGNASVITAYTTLARIALGVDNNTDMGTDWKPADVIGQSTWRVSEARRVWGIWSVSMVSEDISLIGAAQRRATQSFFDRATLIFQPFTVWVWLTLLGSVLITWMILLKLATRRKYTSEEISDVDLLHYSCMSIFGQGDMDHSRANVKAFSTGWLVFGFLIAEIYAANLTAILGEAPELISPFEDITEVDREQLSFCVQDGTANDVYFSNHDDFKSLNIRRVADETTKITEISDSFDTPCTSSTCCAAAEVTREDLILWSLKFPSKNCNIDVIGNVLVRRSRGMMARPSASCIIVGLNHVFHELGVRNCTGSTQQLLTASGKVYCDHRDLYLKFFPDRPLCASVSVYTQESLTLLDLTSAFIILATMLLFGTIGSYTGTRWRTSPCFRHCSATQTAIVKREAILKDMDNIEDMDVPQELDYCCGRARRPPGYRTPQPHQQSCRVNNNNNNDNNNNNNNPNINIDNINPNNNNNNNTTTNNNTARVQPSDVPFVDEFTSLNNSAAVDVAVVDVVDEDDVVDHQPLSRNNSSQRSSQRRRQERFGI